MTRNRTDPTDPTDPTDRRAILPRGAVAWLIAGWLSTSFSTNLAAEAELISSGFAFGGGDSASPTVRMQDSFSSAAIIGEQTGGSSDLRHGWLAGVNNAPIAGQTSLSVTGRVDQVISFSYDDILRRSQTVDPDGDKISFFVTSPSGTLTTDGITAGNSVVLVAGASATWQPPAVAGNLAVIISAVAGDGIADSTTPIVFTGLTLPFIVRHPQDLEIQSGTDAFFGVEAGGSLPLRYQWMFKGAPLAGSTNMTLTVLDAIRANAGAYAVVVSNPAGSILSSNAVLRVTLPRVEPPRQASGGGVTLTLDDFDGSPPATPAEAGFIVLWSRNLITWQELTDVVFRVQPNGALELIDPTPDQLQRFYRVVKR
jgi:hypothetical protein